MSHAWVLGRSTATLADGGIQMVKPEIGRMPEHYDGFRALHGGGAEMTSLMVVVVLMSGPDVTTPALNSNQSSKLWQRQHRPLRNKSGN
jgi:hypothetical protein